MRRGTEPLGASAPDLGRDVRVESVCPLRLRLLVEAQRRGWIAAAADRVRGRPAAGVHAPADAPGGDRPRAAPRQRARQRPQGAGSLVAGHAARILERMIPDCSFVAPNSLQIRHS